MPGGGGGVTSFVSNSSILDLSCMLTQIGDQLLVAEQQCAPSIACQYAYPTPLPDSTQATICY